MAKFGKLSKNVQTRYLKNEKIKMHGVAENPQCAPNLNSRMSADGVLVCILHGKYCKCNQPQTVRVLDYANKQIIHGRGKNQG